MGGKDRCGRRDIRKIRQTVKIGATHRPPRGGRGVAAGRESLAPPPASPRPPTRESQTPPMWDYFESYFLIFLPTGAHSRKMSKYNLLEICHTRF